ncbi:MAG: Uncharacterised protein [Porticoccaceae bacterium UBA1117]|nr:MAG: Uncharacterised protein [Porticoccaceae bacterium UBA1117]
MYNGCPGPISKATSCSQAGAFTPWPNHVLIDVGNNNKLLAKIAGITPAMFTFNGK